MYKSALMGYNSLISAIAVSILKGLYGFESIS